LQSGRELIWTTEPLLRSFSSQDFRKHNFVVLVYLL
jgi:hypothetical protein